MLKNKVYYGFAILALLLSAYLFASIVFSSDVLQNNINRPQMDLQTKQKIDDIYDQNFLFPLQKIELTPHYVPKLEPTSFDIANQYAQKFKLPKEKLVMGEKGFAYEDKNNLLVVSSNFNQIRYVNIQQKNLQNMRLINQESTKSKNNDDIDKQPAKMTNENAIDKALLYYAQYQLPISYEDIVVNQNEESIIVTFVSKLAGLPNYAFPCVVELDINGEILSLDWYDMSYERLISCHVMPMKEAYYKLPTEFHKEMKIDLKNCQLVYIYENSILQPAYLFEGEHSDGGSFRCFINATKYTDY